MNKIALIQSCWHKEIVDQFRLSFAENGKDFCQELEVIEAPGVVEIPLLAKLAAQSGRFDAVVVAGLIVDHGVYRHEFVAQSVMDSIMKIQIDTEIPMIYGILTAQDFISEGREKFFFEHFRVKGEEAANACRKTLSNIAMLRPAVTRAAS